ncbi:MAG TPA: nitrogen regulation protein NR(II) [Candidatus Binatia bacterium]|nr:nitrogen regulation protein NR(II) [Candidatus Binatia bacterium]
MKFTNRGRPSAEGVLDGLTTAVICLDADLRVSTLNSASESLLGVSPRHAQGQPLAVALPQFAPHAPRLREALDAGSGFIERELRLARNGEPGIVVDCTVTPLLLGRRPGLVIELMPLERHLRIARDEVLTQQFDASRELIRGLAHEIKNPLGGIRGAAQLLERDFPDSRHHEYTRVIIREADRLQNLVDRMLGPSRPPRSQPLNVHQVLEHVRQLVEAEAPAGVSVVRDYDPSLPEVLGDREQLIQALLNLARNALQSVGARGRIVLRSRSRRQVTLNGRPQRLAALMEVEDDGPGIEPDMIEKIFYPMVSTRPGGTGLGLPIAQQLVHGHGGQIECRSVPGTTVFSLLLPIET